jgi:DNA polymerase-3 subunit delta'
MELSSVLGHTQTLNLIKAIMEKSKFCGTYIFCGPDGIGKKMIAKIVARKLNNAEENTEHPDIHVIEHGQSQIKIEDIRDIQRQANLRPYQGKMNIFIIDNAHKLNLDAANSLLKVLEEPPQDTLIILITHKPQNIIKTVLSRCKQIKFAPLAKCALEDILIKNYCLDKTIAHFLSFYSEGRIGLALKLKDASILEEKNKIIDSFVFSSKAIDHNIIGQSKEQMCIFFNILASWFRDIYLLKSGLPDKEAIHLDRKNDLLKEVARLSFKQLDDIMMTISESLLYLEKNINSKLILYNLGAQLWKA